MDITIIKLRKLIKEEILKESSDDIGLTELELYIDNDRELYEKKKLIILNLMKKIQSGKYDHTLAPKLWLYLVDAGAKKYLKEFGSTDDLRVVFPKQLRMELAQSMANEGLEEIKSGEWNYLLTKKP